jgi:hypothetical protein
VSAANTVDGLRVLVSLFNQRRLLVRLFLIDPFKGIEEWEYNGDWKTIAPALDCSLFDVVRFNDKGDVVYVDDEGLLCQPQFFFTITGYPTPLAGRGIVAGTDDEGETVAPTVTLEWVRKNVTFLIYIGDGLFAPYTPGDKEYND